MSFDTEVRYTIDELENAIDYLEQASEYYKDKEEKHRFKWMMISLHGALYGFGVCAIKGSRSLENVTKSINGNSKKFQKKKLELESIFNEFDIDFEEMTKINLAKLISIWDVLDRCKSEEYMMKYTYSKVLNITADQEHAINKLIEYRNQFAHFKPSTYGIVGNYEKDIVFPVVKVIKFLSLESNNVNYFKAGMKERVIDSISTFETSQ